VHREQGRLILQSQSADSSAGRRSERTGQGPAGTRRDLERDAMSSGRVENPSAA